MMKIMQISIVIAALFFSCGDKEKIESLASQNAIMKEDIAKLKIQIQEAGEAVNRFNFLAKKIIGIKARIITNYGNIELKFYPEKAPLHCFNFITRAESGFYNSTQFHRVIPGFMIQGGDPNSKDQNPADDGSGGPLVAIPHEFNDISHKPGVLSMARTSNLGAGAGCQFFIMHGAASHLDNQYTAFGEVTEGMDVVDKIANVKTYGKEKIQLQDHPIKSVVIKSIEIFK